MDQKQVKEILGEQLELLAEVSKGKPGNLPELSEAMCEIADRLKEVYDPIIQKNQRGEHYAGGKADTRS